MSVLQSFPLDVEPYPHQRDVLLALEKALTNETKKFLVLRAPTGSGKSAIAITLARETVRKGGSVHLLASHRFLQEQYRDDYAASSGLKLLWGKANYACTRAEEIGRVDREGNPLSAKKCLANNQPRGYIIRNCTSSKFVGDMCPYITAKTEAQTAKITLNNYASFLAHAGYAGTFAKRDLMIVDEAHLAASIITDFVSIQFPLGQLLSKDEVRSAPDSDKASTYVQWLVRTLIPALEQNLHGEIGLSGYSSGSGESNQDVATRIANDYPLLASDPSTNLTSVDSPQQRAIKLNRILEKTSKLLEMLERRPDNWVCYRTYTNSKGTEIDSLEFKPVVVGGLAHRSLFDFADKVLLMSATLDPGPFLRDLGIRKRDVATFLDVPSVFPITRRPVIAEYCGSMSLKNRDTTLPKVAAKIGDIMFRHGSEKGVIHLHSYKNGADLRDILDEHVRDRIIWHEPGVKSEEVIEEFYNSKDSWLASPSVTEGLDGKGDRVRVQVILKAPYPYMGDPRVKARMGMDGGNTWYSVSASNTLVQAYGRGTRNKEDYSVTYLLDSSISRVVSQARPYLPGWVLDTWSKTHPNCWHWDGSRWKLRA